LKDLEVVRRIGQSPLINTQGGNSIALGIFKDTFYRDKFTLRQKEHFPIKGTAAMFCRLQDIFA